MCRLCSKAPFGYCKCGCDRPVGSHGCTAHSKRSAILCNGSAVTGRCTCRMHAGKALRGVANPNFIHGGFSKSIPARYLEAAEESLRSEGLRSNSKQIALMDARTDELFSQLSSGGHGEQLKVALKSARTLRSRVKEKAQIKILDGMIATLQDGIAEDAVWDDLVDLWEQRRRTVDTDSRIAFRASVALSEEQALTLAAVVVQAAKDLIVDPVKLQEFADRIEANTPGGLVALTRDSSHEVL